MASENKVPVPPTPTVPASLVAPPSTTVTDTVPRSEFEALKAQIEQLTRTAATPATAADTTHPFYNAPQRKFPQDEIDAFLALPSDDDHVRYIFKQSEHGFLELRQHSETIINGRVTQSQPVRLPFAAWTGPGSEIKDLAKDPTGQKYKFRFGYTDLDQCPELHRPLSEGGISRVGLMKRLREDPLYNLPNGYLELSVVQAMVKAAYDRQNAEHSANESEAAARDAASQRALKAGIKKR